MHPYSSIRTALLLALTLCLTAVCFAAEDSFQRTLSVNGPVTLQVSTTSGHIHVSSGADNQVQVTGHVRAVNSWFGGNPQDLVSKIVAAPPIAQAGNIIRIESSRSDETFSHVSIDYDIITPPNTLLTASTLSGDIQLSGIKGTVKAQTMSGGIHANGLGAGSKLQAESGGIVADDLGGSAILQTGSGEIRAQFSAEGDVTAETGSGSIHLSNVRGAVKVETGSGSLDVSGRPTSPWKLETGSGSITLEVGNAPFTLDAEAGSGSVQSALPIATQGSLNKHHLIGTVNGGGPTIKAETGSGSIRIQ